MAPRTPMEQFFDHEGWDGENIDFSDQDPRYETLTQFYKSLRSSTPSQHPENRAMGRSLTAAYARNDSAKDVSQAQRPRSTRSDTDGSEASSRTAAEHFRSSSTSLREQSSNSTLSSSGFVEVPVVSKAKFEHLQVHLPREPPRPFADNPQEASGALIDFHRRNLAGSSKEEQMPRYPPTSSEHLQVIADTSFHEHPRSRSPSSENLQIKKSRSSNLPRRSSRSLYVTSISDIDDNHLPHPNGLNPSSASPTSPQEEPFRTRRQVAMITEIPRSYVFPSGKPVPLSPRWANRCYESACPLRFPHNQGSYHHNGQRRTRAWGDIFGSSNPPDEIWRAFDNMRSLMGKGGTKDDEDMVIPFAKYHFGDFGEMEADEFDALYGDGVPGVGVVEFGAIGDGTPVYRRVVRKRGFFAAIKGMFRVRAG